MWSRVSHNRTIPARVRSDAFLDDNTLRSGQQAALGHDLLELMDGLGIQRAVLAGYDWDGQAPLPRILQGILDDDAIKTIVDGG